MEPTAAVKPKEQHDALPLSVTQYCFHFRRVTSSSFFSFCRVTRGLKNSHPALRTTPCSFSYNKSSCSKLLSDSPLESSVSEEVSVFSRFVLLISSSRMKFSYMFCLRASLLTALADSLLWDKTWLEPGDHTKVESCDGASISVVKLSILLSKYSLPSLYFGSCAKKEFVRNQSPELWWKDTPQLVFRFVSCLAMASFFIKGHFCSPLHHRLCLGSHWHHQHHHSQFSQQNPITPKPLSLQALVTQTPASNLQIH